MPYVHITKTPGKNLDDYRHIVSAVGDSPVSGRISHYAGTEDGSLMIVDVWQSRDDADRFTAERLFPAFAAAWGRPPENTVIFAYDAEAVDA